MCSKTEYSAHDNIALLPLSDEGLYYNSDGELEFYKNDECLLEDKLLVGETSDVIYHSNGLINI